MTPSPDKTLPQNALGRDLAVGDIHGHFALLQQALDTLDFDPARDRLFSVGDLADRGPECSEVIHWLARPWFHPVCGNHDDYVCRYESCDRENWIRNGGGWFQHLTLPSRRRSPSTTAACPWSSRWPPRPVRSGCFTPIVPSPPGRGCWTNSMPG